MDVTSKSAEDQARVLLKYLQEAREMTTLLYTDPHGTQMSPGQVYDRATDAIEHVINPWSYPPVVPLQRLDG